MIFVYILSLMAGISFFKKDTASGFGLFSNGCLDLISIFEGHILLDVHRGGGGIAVRCQVKFSR